MDFDDDTNILEFELKNNKIPLANQVINGDINGISFTLTTNVNGKAYMTLTNYATGRYTVTYSYAGNDKYNGDNGVDYISITNSSGKSTTELDMDFDDDTNILEFELKSNDLALANQVINVGINGTSFTVTTDINGKAYMTLSNYTPGYYTVTYSYPGTDKVNGVNRTELIIITNSAGKNSTELDMDFDDDINILEFDLSINDYPLANQVINVGINGTSFTVTTNVNGKAYMTLSNYTPGQYTVNYSYLGTDKVSGINKTGTIIISNSSKLVTDLDMDFDDDTNILEFDLNSNNKALANKTIQVNINGTNFTLTTNVNGKAYMTLSNYTPGQYIVKYYFEGDKTYNPSSGIETISITNGTGSIGGLYGENLTMVYGSLENYTGKLIGDDGNPIIGQHVSIKLSNSQGQSKIYSATTDVKGEYQLEINLYPGEYTALASYGKYSCLNTISVMKDSSITKSVLSANKFSEPYGAGQNFTGKLLDANGNPLIGQHIAIKLSNTQGQSKVYWANTDYNGEYQLEICLYSGVYSAQCSFGGNSKYSDSSASTSITVTS